MGRLSAEMQRDVHGLQVAASGDWPEVVEALDRDLAWFPPGTGTPDVSVRYARRAPDRSDHPASLEAVRITQRSAEYRDGSRSIVDFGRALSVDDGAGSLTVEGLHGWTAWRAGHVFLLNRIDAHLRTLDLVRLNGLGLAGRDGGVLVLLPSGGGKTTLALSAIEAGAGLLSEERPLLDAGGRMHPFPLPLLVRPTSPEAADLPREHVRSLPGIDPSPASLEVSAFRDAVPADPVALRHVVIGVRTLNGAAALEPLPRREAVRGLAQATLASYGVRTGAAVHAKPSRLAGFARGLAGARAWKLTLGPDRDANWRALAPLC